MKWDVFVNTSKENRIPEVEQYRKRKLTCKEM